MQKFDIKKIHNTIWVFKKAIPDPDKIIDFFEKNREWHDWYTFGKYAEGGIFNPSYFEKFPNRKEWEDKLEEGFGHRNQDRHFENQVNNNIAKYKTNLDVPLAMHYHTDYQREFSYQPGDKFGITAVFYLNDNYVGGEVLFRFLDESDINIIKEDYVYKPEAGDVVVFMSGHPHYHGVNSVTSGEKYIIRTYWKYRYPGHPLWLKLEEKYGKDSWAEIEEERRKFNRIPENMKMVNGIPFWVEFEEYYKKDIESLGL